MVGLRKLMVILSVDIALSKSKVLCDSLNLTRRRGNEQTLIATVFSDDQWTVPGLSVV